MAKLYTKKLSEKRMLPKKETICLILQYSSALSIIKIGNFKINLIAN